MTSTWTLAPADGEPLATFTGRRGADAELLRFELAGWADGDGSDGADGGGDGGGD